MVNPSAILHRSPLDTNWVNEIEFDSHKKIHAKYNLVKSGLSSWANKTYSDRAKALINLARILELHRPAMNKLIRLETGKTLLNCEGEFDAAISMIRLLSSYEFFPMGEVLPSKNVKRFVYSVRAPHGVVFLIFPSNAPLPNFIWKLAPALMAGNVVLAKPSPHTGKTFEFLLDLLRQSGFDEDVVQRVDGEEELLRQVVSLGVDLVSFTGSTNTGSEVARVAGPSLAKLVLECGGVNPFIVDASADIDMAVPIFCESAFGNSGQRCASASVLLVHESIRDAFLDKTLNYLKGFTTGLDEESRFGPMCTPEYVDRLERELNKQDSSRILKLTRLVSSNEFTFQPTLVDLKRESSSLFESEMYGPVCGIDSFKSFEFAIDSINQSPFGLTASVWSNETKSIEFARANVKYGVLNFNGPTFGSEPNFPFGGYRLSGNGTKEAGYSCIEEYSTKRVISEFSIYN